MLLLTKNTIKSIVHYDYSDNFYDRKGKKQQFFTGKIKSKIMFIKKIELLSCIEKIQLEVKCENKSKNFL